MSEPTQQRRRVLKLGGLELTRHDGPRRRGQYFEARVAAVVGVLSAAFHDAIYRQTQPKGSGDFELWGTVSHAGLDVLLATFAIVAMLIFVKWRERT